MIYCIHCGRQVDENLDTCPHCGQDNKKNIEENNKLRTLNRTLHSNENLSRERFDNGMVHVVLGTTLLIIGALFFFLSFKMDQETFTKKLTFTTPEFWVSMTGLGVGGALLLAGLICVLNEKVVVQNNIKRLLKLTQSNSYALWKEAESEFYKDDESTKENLGYLNASFNRNVNVIFAIIPLTSWILGGVTRIRRKRYLSGVLQILFPLATLYFWIVDIISMTSKGDLF